MTTVPSPSTPYPPTIYNFVWPELNELSLQTIQFDTTFSDGSVEGRLQWNANEGTLEVGLPGGSVVLQIGEEQLIRVRNTTGSLIPNGTAVYAAGASGNNLVVDLADTTIDATAIAILGLTTESIANNQFGYVTSFGLVRDLNTNGLGVGTRLFLGTAGSLTTVEPTAPNRKVNIGLVVVDDATNGIVFTRIRVVPRLDELSDVYAPAPNDGDKLTWVAASSRWEAVP